MKSVKIGFINGLREGCKQGGGIHSLNPGYTVLMSAVCLSVCLCNMKYPSPVVKRTRLTFEEGDPIGQAPAARHPCPITTASEPAEWPRVIFAFLRLRAQRATKGG